MRALGVRTDRRLPRCAPVAILALSLTIAVGRTTGAASSAQDDARPSSHQSLLEALADPAREGAALRPAFEAFVAAMDRFDGPGALELARAMHTSALRIREGSPGTDVLWSVFCLEGALRRSAPGPGAIRAAHLKEAREVIAKHLDDPSSTTSDREALLQRLAILEAGFGERAAERAALGGALALHGIDGAQITALQRLDDGDSRAAAALFATLLDSTDPARVGAPWALRGHAMAVLDRSPE